jgi:hypothetical protein
MNNWLRYHSHIVDSPCCCDCHVLRDCWHAREFGGSWPLRIVGRNDKIFEHKAHPNGGAADV